MLVTRLRVLTKKSLLNFEFSSLRFVGSILFTVYLQFIRSQISVVFCWQEF